MPPLPSDPTRGHGTFPAVILGRRVGQREGRETGVMVYSYCAGEDGYTMFTRSFHPFSPPAVLGVQFSRAHIKHVWVHPTGPPVSPLHDPLPTPEATGNPTRPTELPSPPLHARALNARVPAARSANERCAPINSREAEAAGTHPTGSPFLSPPPFHGPPCMSTPVPGWTAQLPPSCA